LEEEHANGMPDKVTLYHPPQTVCFPIASSKLSLKLTINRLNHETIKNWGSSPKTENRILNEKKIYLVALLPNKQAQSVENQLEIA